VSTGGNAVIVYHTVAIEDGAPVFAPEPQTFFVGTAPASATVADINDDGIADMLIANRGSNDVSVLFGSYDGDGAWQGVAGPRLSSGGAGPISVAVRELTDNSVLDLVVINGQSGTLTVLPGVGQGFFDDRSPQTLLDLGAAVVEPPSFADTSNVGFAVTAGGELLQFDLSDASAGARIVFSEQVLSARALSTGQVVVAGVDGSVKVLKPDGDVLVVESVLEAQGGVPILPSSLAVLQTGAGQFQVLVSSQGSDTVSVFATASVTQSIPIFLPFVPATSNSSTLSSSFFNGAGGFGLSALSNTVNVALGLSLAGFSTTGSLVFTTTSSAALVSVEGNSYSTVAVLDFGSQQDDTSGDGRGRMPELSSRFPIGDTSPLAKFVIGLNGLIEDYRDEAKESELMDDEEDPEDDPWTTDLFFRQRRLHKPERDPAEAQKPEAAEPTTTGPAAETPQQSDDGAAEGQTLLDNFWEQRPDIDSGLPPVNSSMQHAAVPAGWPILLTGLIAAVRHQSTSASRAVRRKFAETIHEYSR
jgi:hypothetical protein